MTEVKNGEGGVSPELTKAQRRHRLLSLAVLIVNCVYLPVVLAVSEAETVISIAVAAADIIYFFTNTRKLGRIIFPAIVYVVASSSFGFLISTAVFSAFVTVSVGGFLVTAAEKRDVAPLICAPALAYLVSYLITLDPILSAASLLFIPAFIALGISGRLRVGRTGAICSVVMTVIVTAALLTGAYVIKNGISVADIQAAINDVRENLVNEFFTALTEYEASIGEVGAVSSSLDKDSLTSALGRIINLLPAIAVVSVSVFSFFANSSCLELLKNGGYAEKLTPAMQTFEISMASGVVFFVAFALSLTTNDMGGSTLLSLVGLNLFIILTPGLILSGYGSIMSILAKRPGGAPLLTLLVFFLIVVFYYVAVFVLAFWGAAAVIVKRVAEWSERPE